MLGHFFVIGDDENSTNHKHNLERYFVYIRGNREKKGNEEQKETGKGTKTGSRKKQKNSEGIFQPLQKFASTFSFQILFHT